jgi:CheY-like chemotaxis protein
MARVLVVEDDLATCEMFRLLLRGEGYQVATCTEGLQCHQMASELRPDLIILDLVLAAVSGMEVITLLKDDQGTRHIPILICSAAIGQLEQLPPSLFQQRIDVVPKPFELNVLLAKINQLVCPLGADLTL